MSDKLIWVLAVCGGLIALGGVVGLTDRKNFSPKWLVVATLLFFLNDVALTRGYGLLPDVLGGDWNWTGKVLALLVTLAVASHPAFGWERSGLTMKHKPGSLRAAVLVSVLVILVYVGFAVAFDNDPPTTETFAYQLTMPGLEEEPFYRGVLLLALYEAFRGRLRALGIDWGWGALFSSALFGLTHALGYQDGSFQFDALYFALTALPSLLVVWIRERTGSLLLPILLHNFGNSIGLFL